MQLKDFKDKYSGRIGFLVGGGPSLHYIDENLLIPHIKIAINSGIVKIPFADFFISDDQSMQNWSYYINLLPKLSCVSLLYKDKLEKHAGHLKNKCFYTHTWWYSPEDNTYNLDGLKLTKDEPIVGARSSMGSALHIAHILGCSPIVLLGNDCQLSRDKYNYRYFWQYYPTDQQPYRIKGLKFSEKNQHIGFRQFDFVEYWQCLAAVNKNIIGKEIEIIDASDSVLNCFPKMSINKVLEKYGEKNE